MSAAVVVAVLVAAGEAKAPATIAIQVAVAEALGPGGSVVVQESVSHSDSEVLRMEDQLRASAIVEVRWSNLAKATVHIRMHAAADDRWIDREISFLPADTMSERGRTIGFAIASMLLPENDTPAPSVASKALPPEPIPDTVPAPLAARSERFSSSGAGALGRDSQPLFHAIDFSGVGSRGFNGPANGLGGSASVEFSILRTWWLRAGAGVRTGSVPRLNGNDIVVSAMGGVAWRPIPTTPARRFGGGIRFEAGILFHDLSHAVVDGTTAHQGRLLPGAVLAAEGIWRLTPALDTILAIGSEVAFGTTEVLVARRSVATIPVFRGLVALGARIRF